jgi:hypothetical protein
LILRRQSRKIAIQTSPENSSQDIISEKKNLIIKKGLLEHLQPNDLQQRSPKHTMEKRQPLQQTLLRKLDPHVED